MHKKQKLRILPRILPCGTPDAATEKFPGRKAINFTLYISKIGLLRVPKTLPFKTRLSAKPLSKKNKFHLHEDKNYFLASLTNRGLGQLQARSVPDQPPVWQASIGEGKGEKRKIVGVPFISRFSPSRFPLFAPANF